MNRLSRISQWPRRASASSARCARRTIWGAFGVVLLLAAHPLGAVDFFETVWEIGFDGAAVNAPIVADIRADEWMRPRTQFQSFRPPVNLADLNGTMTPSGYLLVTDPDSEEIDTAIHLKELADVPREHLEHYAEPVVQLPWCATVADALQELTTKHRQVAAIVNEFGETIGILTLEDILDTVFTYHPSRSRLLLGKKPIHDISEDVWLAAGVTSLRRLSRYLQIELPSSKSVTLAGVIQHSLGRIAAEGDTCHWGPFEMQVLEAPERGHMLIKLTRLRSTESTP